MPTTMLVPIFVTYTVSELAGKDYPRGLLPYGEDYLLRLKEGRTKLTDTFIFTACGILNRTREELFGDPGG